MLSKNGKQNPTNKERTERNATVCHYFGTTGRKREKSPCTPQDTRHTKRKGVHLFAADTRRERIKRPVHFARKKSQ